MKSNTMKMYTETDNRLIKDESKKEKDKKEKSNSETLAESYGLSKNARIIME